MGKKDLTPELINYFYQSCVFSHLCLAHQLQKPLSITAFTTDLDRDGIYACYRPTFEGYLFYTDVDKNMMFLVRCFIDPEKAIGHNIGKEVEIAEVLAPKDFLTSFMDKRNEMQNKILIWSTDKSDKVKW